jgi:hypothetical protein
MDFDGYTQGLTDTRRVLIGIGFGLLLLRGEAEYRCGIRRMDRCVSRCPDRLSRDQSVTSIGEEASPQVPYGVQASTESDCMPRRIFSREDGVFFPF